MRGTALKIRSFEAEVGGIVEELRGTIFFGKDGWPDSRAQVLLQAGEVLPVAYAFPHAEVTITSIPNGAEIFLGLLHSASPRPRLICRRANKS